MKVLIIDNYDSFTYNLYQYAGVLLTERGGDFLLDVKRNDEISIEEIKTSAYDRIIISPGPGDPSDEKYFGVCSKVITDIGKTTPVLGVCLGMQGIAHYFGGKVVRARKPMHGKTSIITHDGRGVFKGLPQGLEVMRYHSLIVEGNNLPNELEITATVRNSDPKSKSKDQKSKIYKDNNEIMGLRHIEYPIEGIQFHPESFATDAGRKMLENFLFNNH